MRRTLSAGSSPASVRDCSPRPSAPPRLKVGADLGEDMPQFLNRLAVEHTAAVFGDEDQMDMHCKDAVSTVPNVIEVRHRPNHNGSMERRQAFQFELLPKGEQQRQMSRSAGCARAAPEHKPQVS